MSTIQTGAPLQLPAHVPLAIRGAQALFLIPLGFLQLAAAIIFSITDGVKGGQYAIGAWALTMATAGTLLAPRLGRHDRRIRRLALTLLALQTAFSTVKLTIYHESASFVFFAIIATALALLLSGWRRADLQLAVTLINPGVGMEH